MWNKECFGVCPDLGQTRLTEREGSYEKSNKKIWIAIAIVAIIVIFLPVGLLLALCAGMTTEEAGTDIIKLRKSGVCSFVLPQSEFDAYKGSIIETYKVDGQDEGSYGHWCGMRVCDINADNPDYTLDDVPSGIHFEKVINDDIGEYTVLLYSPTGTGTRSFGIFVDNSSCRVVCYYNATIR